MTLFHDQIFPIQTEWESMRRNLPEQKVQLQKESVNEYAVPEPASQSRSHLQGEPEQLAERGARGKAVAHEEAASKAADAQRDQVVRREEP